MVASLLWLHCIMLLIFLQIAFSDDRLMKAARCTTHSFENLKDRLAAVSSPNIVFLLKHLFCPFSL
jgi:hypothetical protein